MSTQLKQHFETFHILSFFIYCCQFSYSTSDCLINDWLLTNQQGLPLALKSQSFQQHCKLVKLNSYSNAKHFFIAFSHAHFVFEVMSAYPIDWNQNAIPRVMPLHELKKVHSRVFHTHDTWFYWSSEKALHEPFIAERWRWVWMEMLWLTAHHSALEKC